MAVLRLRDFDAKQSVKINVDRGAYLRSQWVALPADQYQSGTWAIQEKYETGSVDAPGQVRRLTTKDS